MAEFGLKDYVVGSNNLYECEGTIIGMHESTGAKKGMLYDILETGGVMVHSFYAEEITKLSMPRIYEHTFEEMCKEWFYENGDKRIARLDLYKNKTRKITRERDTMYLSFNAYGKNYVYSAPMSQIKHNFSTKIPRDYKHNCDIARYTISVK